jgi:hypothetical protein
MILVELTRNMLPRRAGEDVLLPNDLAEALIEQGQARNPRDRFGVALTLPLEAQPPKLKPPKKYVTK